VNLGKVGGFEGVGSVRAAWRVHDNHLRINTIQIYSIIDD
jgi:hypothetical protein